MTKEQCTNFVLLAACDCADNFSFAHLPNRSNFLKTELITEAIVSLAERGGSSRQALKSYIKEKYPVGDNFDSQFNLAVRRGLDTEFFSQPKGPAGSIKLVKKPKSEETSKPVAKKPVEKKPEVKKTVLKKKAPVSKTSKKSAGKVTKKSTTKKSTPAKKSSAKKSKK